MPKTLSEILKPLPPARRARIEAETRKEAAKIMTLREVRKTFRLSQEAVAKTLGKEQESVSRIERRADLMLSTLRDYVEAMGGHLKLVAEFPQRGSVQIETFSQLDAGKRMHRPRTKSRGRKTRRA